MTGPGGRSGRYERLVRPVLFRCGSGDAEAAHALALRWLARSAGLLRLVRPYSPPGAARTVFGVRFPNPVGLAAGMDKDAVALPAWPALGFGFVELGTVTWHRQAANDGPRLVRLPGSGAVINRLGFPNSGAPAVAARLAALPPLRVPLGISLGRSRVTGDDGAAADYRSSLRALYPYGDYFVVNVSSPNTTGLRRLQGREQLAQLLAVVRAEVRSLAGGPGHAIKPVLVKIAPDLSDSALGDVLEVCAEHEVSGLVATNTTTSRQGLAPREATLGRMPGGLSGAPLTRRVREVVAFVSRETGGALPVIGVGGVMSGDDALRLFDAGASLVQILTGLVYHGPGLVREAVRACASGIGLPEAALGRRPLVSGPR
ncbi:MAG TPA: quinone-dependent dihydroorotate dehydrogenase [Micromonosporaceae bacterium]|nr:quinone-dependent dihydroorotate dehydrogenase [Micromonosporaceae bacterium]